MKLVGPSIKTWYFHSYLAFSIYLGVGVFFFVFFNFNLSEDAKIEETK